MTKEVVEQNNSEVEARQFGWVPKEEFNGDESQWRDADEFLRRGREINGFLRKDLDKIKGQLSAKDSELKELRDTMEEFKRFTKQNAEREFKTQLEQLKLEKKQAISEGDGDKVVELDEQIDAIKEQQRQVPQPQQVNPQVVLNEWLSQEENKIFVQDPEVMELADTIAPGIKAKNPNLAGREYLEEVAKQVKKLLPNKFDSGKERPSAVSSSTDSGVGRSGGKKKSYADLPPDAKAACDKFVKQGLMKQAEYVSEYFGGE